MDYHEDLEDLCMEQHEDINVQKHTPTEAIENYADIEDDEDFDEQEHTLTEDSELHNYGPWVFNFVYYCNC